MTDHPETAVLQAARELASVELDDPLLAIPSQLLLAALNLAEAGRSLRKADLSHGLALQPLFDAHKAAVKAYDDLRDATP